MRKTVAACLMLLGSLSYAQSSECQIRPNAAAGTSIRDTAGKRLDVGKIIASSKVRNGSVLLHNQTGKYRPYAKLIDGRIAAYEAFDSRGQKLKTTVASGDIYCKVCVYDTITKQVVCWPIDCKDLPRPGVNPKAVMQ